MPSPPRESPPRRGPLFQTAVVAALTGLCALAAAQGLARRMRADGPWATGPLDPETTGALGRINRRAVPGGPLLPAPFARSLPLDPEGRERLIVRGP